MSRYLNNRIELPVATAARIDAAIARLDYRPNLLAKRLQALEVEGILVRRGRERLEREIGHFVVLEHDHRIIGCAALYPFTEEQSGELACLVVQSNYRNQGYGDLLLKHITVQAQAQGLRKLFVLTTRTAHWFIERGFNEADVGQLPAQKKALYNYQRRSKVFLINL